MLYFQSLNALEVALGLYGRMGFEDVPAPPEMAVPARTQVIMARATWSVRFN